MQWFSANRSLSPSFLRNCPSVFLSLFSIQNSQSVGELKLSTETRLLAYKYDKLSLFYTRRILIYVLFLTIYYIAELFDEWLCFSNIFF